MASYRFCRTDDLPLLVEAHEACYAVHFPGLAPLKLAGIKRAAREIDLWASSSMVASVRGGPIAVLLASKRESETLIWRVGVRPDHLRQGHGRHLLTSLSQKLAILGPPRIVAEIPADLHAGRALLEACGYTRERTYTDFTAHPEAGSIDSRGVLAPVSLEELIDHGALDRSVRRPWGRAPATLINKQERLVGWAVAAEVRIEAWCLCERPAEGPVELLAFGCADATRTEAWLGLLVRQASGGEGRPVRFARVDPEEIPFETLARCGFAPGRQTVAYAAAAERA